MVSHNLVLFRPDCRVFSILIFYTLKIMTILICILDRHIPPPNVYITTPIVLVVFSDSPSSCFMYFSSLLAPNSVEVKFLSRNTEVTKTKQKSYNIRIIFSFYEACHFPKLYLLCSKISPRHGPFNFLLHI
jgi:hypothetical protein